MVQLNLWTNFPRDKTQWPFIAWVGAGGRGGYVGEGAHDWATPF